MSCFICNKCFKIRPGTTRYLKPSQLTSKLQDRKWEPGTFKPDVKILEALEDVSDGSVTLEILKKHKDQYICHECQVNLRQVVNKQAELEHHIQVLTERISVVSNKERRNYYREYYGKDKAGRCWGCMYQFVPADYQKKRSERLHLATPIVEGMSVCEAINSVLEHEAESLIGLYERKTYVCKMCVQLLRNVVRSQCVFDTLQTSFQSMTDEDSLFARLMRDEKVPFTLDSSKVVKHSDTNDDGTSSEQRESESSTDLNNVKSDRCNKRPFHKTSGNLPMARKKSIASPKKRKLSEGSSSEYEATEFESEEENESAKSEIESSDKQIRELDAETVIVHCLETTTDSVVAVASEINPHQSSGIKLNAEIKDIDDRNDFYDYPADSSKDIVRESVKKATKNDSKDNKKVKKNRHVSVKLSLQGEEIKAVSVMEEGKKEKEMNYSITTLNTDLQRRKMSDDWVLYYYPKFSGRAEFVRLIFEEAGIPYRECEESFADIRRLITDGEMEGYPHFAPPMVKKGNIQVSQTPVICRYLGEEFGLYPESLEDRLHAEQISQCCHDYIAEGRLSFHGINPVGTYLSQKTETQPYIDRFVSERLPRWLKFFERVMSVNQGGKGFLFGEKICYCDLSVFHIIHATESQFPEAYKSAQYIPLLKSFKERIASRPRIASYLRSDRWRGFFGDSMM